MATNRNDSVANNENQHEYYLPYKPAEDNRLNSQHILLKKIFGGLSVAPLDTSRPLKVLDIGCGTGAWVVDFANEHPDCQVHGVDIATYSDWKKQAPANCSFAQVDIEDPMQWGTLPKDFDYVHGRFLTSAIRDWTGLFERCRAHLKVGGWLEMQDFALPVQCEASGVPISESYFFRWGTLFLDALRRGNVNGSSAYVFPFTLKGAGFTKVSSKDFRMIIGEWPDNEAERELGRLGQATWVSGARGFSGKVFPKMLGMSEEEHEELVAAALEESASGKYKTYLPIKVAFGQK